MKQGLVLITMLFALLVSSYSTNAQSKRGAMSFSKALISSGTSVDTYLEVLENPELLKPTASDPLYRPKYAEVITSFGELKTFYEYDNQNRLTTVIIQNQQGDSLVNFSKMNYSTEFNAVTGDTLYIAVQQIWTLGTWVNSQKFSLGYSSSSRRVSDTVYTWVQNSWTPLIATSYSYNEGSQLKQSDSHIWNGLQWDLHSRVNYLYDSKGNIASEEYLAVRSGELRNSSRFINSYDDLGNLIQIQYDEWNDTTWVPESRNTYTYSDSFSSGLKKISSLLFESMESDQWSALTLTEYIFDEHGARKEDVTKIKFDTTWINGFKTTYGIDGNGNNHVAQVFLWDNDSWATSEGGMTPTYNKGINENYYYGSSVTVVYEQPLSFEEEEVNPSSMELAQNYPNPFNPSTTLTISMSETASVKLSVYNALGEQISTLFEGSLSPGVHRFTFEAQNLTSGVYFARLTDGSSTQIKKMLYLK